MSVSIRRLAPEEAPAFAALWTRGLNDHPDAFTWGSEDMQDAPMKRTESWLKQSLAWGAYAAGELQGFVIVNPQRERKRRHIAVIGPVYVAPELRGTGAARALMEYALTQLPEEVEMAILAAGSNNTPAQKLYRALGFQSWGVQPRALKLPDGSYVDEEWMAWFRK